MQTIECLPAYLPGVCRMCGATDGAHYVVFCAGGFRSTWFGFGREKPKCKLGYVGCHLHRSCDNCGAEYCEKPDNWYRFEEANEETNEEIEEYEIQLQPMGGLPLPEDNSEDNSENSSVADIILFPFPPAVENDPES